MSHWSSGIGAQDRWHLSKDTAPVSGWISLRLGELCMISTEVLCAAASKLGNSSSYSVCTVSSLVRASDWNSEDPGSNPGCISMSFFAIMLLCFACDKPLQFWHFISNLRSYLCSVGVKEVGISFPLLSALLAGLLLQHTLHTSVCYVSCNRSDPSVLVAGKSRSRAKILVLVLKKKKQLLKKNGLPHSLLLYYTRPETSITSACFSSNS